MDRGGEGEVLVVTGEHSVRGREVVCVEPWRPLELDVDVDVSFTAGLKSSAEKSVGLIGESGTEGWWLQWRMTTADAVYVQSAAPVLRSPHPVAAPADWS